MKIVNYYARPDLPFFPDGCGTPDGQLATWMLDVVVCEQAHGEPPWPLDIPRDAILHLFRSISELPLFKINVVPGKSGSNDPAELCSPFDTAIIRFPDVEVRIHYRRQVPFRDHDMDVTMEVVT